MYSELFIAIFIGIFILRLFTLFFSIKNEKRLKAAGAVEHGKLNSTVMALLHLVFYISSFVEAIITDVSFNSTTILGIVLFSFSYVMLLIVIYQLKEVWTVKLLIAKEHKINKSFLFKFVRHPNYFLNIVPELIGIGLFSKSWRTMAIILPIYFVVLIVRISQEENVMKKNFANF